MSLGVRSLAGFIQCYVDLVPFPTALSQCFVVSRLTRDQVEDYAKPKGWSVDDVGRWLASNLDYDT